MFLIQYQSPGFLICHIDTRAGNMKCSFLQQDIREKHDEGGENESRLINLTIVKTERRCQRRRNHKCRMDFTEDRVQAGQTGT
jgi:hypothetical protein